jgi:hypothetical protein
VTGVDGMGVAEFGVDGFGVAEALLDVIGDVEPVGFEVGLVVAVGVVVDDDAKGEGVWVRLGEEEGETAGALLEKYHKGAITAAIIIAAIKNFDQVGSFI